MQHIGFESFGVRVRVSTDAPEVLERIPVLLPPDSRPCGAHEAEESFGVLREMDGSYRFTRSDDLVTRGLDLDFALTLLDYQLRIYVALHAANRTFIHAGVVAHEGRAIVLPGLSFAGKTTLVLALVRAGAVYYSDEYAVLDDRGWVHPYSRSPYVRDDVQHHRAQDLRGLGATVAGDALPVGMVVVTNYVANAHWSPKRIGRGAAALALLANTVAARSRPDESMRAIIRALEHAVALEGERGEASDMAERLLEGAFP